MFNKIIDNFKNFFQSENRHRLFKICIPALIIVASFTLMSFFPMYIGIKEKAESLVELANKNGGRDNISLILVHI